MKIKKTIGLIAAPPNKFGADGQVEIDMIRPLADKLHRDGAAGVFVNGARGGVGSTYNTDTPLYLELIDAFDCGELDTARDLQAEAVAIINQLAGTGDFLSALKSRLREQGIPM